MTKSEKKEQEKPLTEDSDVQKKESEEKESSVDSSFSASDVFLTVFSFKSPSCDKFFSGSFFSDFIITLIYGNFKKKY